MKIGLFGGTFDPPHLGHLIVAREVYEMLDLDLVVFVPAAQPPHKLDKPITDAATRLEMLRAAVADDPAFAIDDRELHRPGPSFTVDTLRAFLEQRDAPDLHLIMGADQYAELATWRQAEEIPRLARIVVLARAGRSARKPEVVPPNANALWVEVTRIDISATLVRTRVAAGRSVRYLVPAGVETIIRRDRLYASPVRTGHVQTG